MMPGRLCVVALSMFGLCGGPAQAGLLSPPEQNRLSAQLDKRPMVFFVAKGPVDSCGPGCGEWIAAEGQFLPGTAQKFKDFLVTLGSRRLPIFFHSPGGAAGAALQIGAALRERKMTAGVGRTFTEQCRIFAKEDPCQRVIAAGGEIRARLRPAEGQCHSACVFAFAGASNRRVAAGALMGVHSVRFNPKYGQAGKQRGAVLAQSAVPFSISAAHNDLERYLILMGIDPRLQQVAAKVDARRMYVLGRDEIARFGVETGGFYETPWAAFADPEKRPFALKSVTRAVDAARGQHRAAGLHFWCFRERIFLIYQREAPPDDARAAAFVRIAAGEQEVSLRYGKDVAAGEMWMAQAGEVFLSSALAAPSLTVTEGIAASESARLGSRELKLSTTGLSSAMSGVLKGCEGVRLPEPARGGGRG